MIMLAKLRVGALTFDEAKCDIKFVIILQQIIKSIVDAFS